MCSLYACENITALIAKLRRPSKRRKPRTAKYIVKRYRLARIGQLNERIESHRPLSIQVMPPRLLLKPENNRGREHPVPVSHLDARLPSSDPVAVASAGIGFYVDAIRAIEQDFSSNQPKINRPSLTNHNRDELMMVTNHNKTAT